MSVAQGGRGLGRLTGPWGGGLGGRVVRPVEGASAVPGEGASCAAVRDPLAEGRCALEG